MNISEENLKLLLLQLLNDFVEENSIILDNDTSLANNTRLLGNSGIFDSMELVQFIVEVENLIEDKFDIDIELTSDKAMSRRNSPFISIETLVKFIIDGIG